MREVLPNLFLLRAEQPAEPTPFTFLAVRPEGNILFGTKADISAYQRDIVKKGPVAMILLGDRHHAGPSIAESSETLNVPLSCSEIEAVPLRKSGFTIGAPLRFERQALAADLEAIPTPGHTPGAFAYLWQVGKDRILFIGDTLVPVDGVWRYWVSKPNREKMADSLRALSTIDFNVIATNSFACTGEPCIRVNAAQRRSLFTGLIDELS